MSTPVPTSLLVMARKRAALSQTQLAVALQVAASVVSRLEATEQADDQMAKRYLSAVNSEFGSQILEFYKQKWRSIERPPFMHPDRGSLWAAEQAMQALDRFQESSQFDVILQDPLSRLKARILTETGFVHHMEHGIAFIGEIGVGKTTALSFLTNLVMADKSGELKSVFPTGSGRTTVCEVAIKIAPTFGIAVDSLAEEEVHALVADLVSGLKTGKGGIPSELERVIRNMADLRRIPSRSKGKPVDHLKDMVEATDDVDQVIAEVISRMKLSTRTEAQMILSESAEGSMEWLAINFAKINYGQHPSFSVPQRITVLMPLNALRNTPYRLSVIDTKGVEGTTQRPDLKAQIDDPRTVTVLCSKFSDAPGSAAISILREVLDSGSDAVESKRICLLVLPKDDEALKVVDDTGNNPSDAEEGYAVREAQIDQQFATEGLRTIPMNFFNFSKDHPEDVWTWLTSMIEQVRANKVSKIHRLVQASQDLILNSDVAKTRQARLHIAETMEQAAARFESLPGIKRHAHLNLVEQAKKSNANSIAASASINRRGKWPNFPIPHILGVGVQKDANLRTRDSFVRLDEQIESLKSKYSHLHDIKEFLDSAQEEMAEWKQEFLHRATLIGRVSFSQYLEKADSLWAKCAHRYGAGGGYRIDVSDIFLTHFEEDPEAQVASEKVEISLLKAWQDIVITPLRQAVGYHDEQAD